MDRIKKRIQKIASGNPRLRARLLRMAKRSYIVDTLYDSPSEPVLESRPKNRRVKKLLKALSRDPRNALLLKELIQEANRKRVSLQELHGAAMSLGVPRMTYKAIEKYMKGQMRLAATRNIRDIKRRLDLAKDDPLAKDLLNRDVRRRTTFSEPVVDLYALVEGDGSLYGADRNPSARFSDFWRYAIQDLRQNRSEWRLYKLENVPESLALKLESQGIHGEQQFDDGYTAWRAALRYAEDEPLDENIGYADEDDEDEDW